MRIGNILIGAVVAATLSAAMPAAAQSAPAEGATPPASTPPASAPPVGAPPASTPPVGTLPDGTAKQPPVYAPAAPPAVTTGTPPVSDDGKHARQTLEAFALREQSTRIVGSYGMLITGAATVGAGLLADLHYDESYGQVLWIAGTLVSVGAVVNLLREGPLETFSSKATSMTPTALREEWATRARKAQSERQVGGIVSIGLGVVAAGAGAAIAAGAGDMREEVKEGWAVGLLFAGGAFIGGGVITMAVKSDAELGYRAAYGADADAPPITVGVTPVPGGGALSLRGAF